MCVFCVHMYSYIPVSRTSLRTRSTVLRRTPIASAAAVRSLGFSKHIFKFPSLFFSFQKLLTLIIMFFKSDDIAFLFGILTACDT